MTNNIGLDVFGVNEEALRYTLEDAKQTIGDKLNPSWIKQRKQGSATLSYIGGHTVIRLLNKAFNYQWSFEIVTEEVVQSLDKPMFDGWGAKRKPVMETIKVLNGDQWVDKQVQKMEPQPPVAKVLGRLTVPGLGVREQYGSKVLIGGATEQESAFKSASTDALKKCASLFGIGLELYGEDEGLETTDEAVQQATSQPTSVQEPAKQPAQTQQQQTKQEPAKQQKAPAQEQTQQSNAGGWQQDDVNRLKELKQILGITDNNQLNPYVREFFDNKDVTWANINPENIKAVNIFLAKKAEAI